MAKPIPMHQIKRIIELLQEGRSIWETKRLTGLSRNTVRDYIRRIQSSGLSTAQLLALNDEALMLVVQSDAFEQGQSGRKIDTRFHTIEKSLDHYNSELHRVGVTRQLLWEEYRKEYPEGYSYSQFCDHLRQHNKKDQAVMRFTHKPGEVFEVDYAGDKTGYVDISTGEWIECDVLVGTMAYSNYMYVEALHSQKQEDLVDGLANAFIYLGGVPPCIKFDNTRTVVVRANRYEPKFTEAMDLLGAHYNTTIITARVRKPRDKPHVEKGVDLTYKRIYAPLRDHTFHSLAQLNAAFREQLDLFNQRAFKNKTESQGVV